MEFLLAAAGAIVGAVVTWVVAKRYYVKASKELATEAAELREKTDLVIYCLTNPGANVTATRDSAGKVTGLTVSAVGTAGLRFSGAANLRDTGAP